MNDLLLITRFKNAPLYDLCRGKKRQDIADGAGICRGVLYDLLSLKRSPFSNTTESGYSIPATKLAAYFNVDLEELFPASLYRLRLPKLLERTLPSEVFISMMEARQQNLLEQSYQPQLVENINSQEVGKYLNESVTNLSTSQKRKVIELRFGLNGNDTHTLEEVAEIMDLSRERIRQIEGRALRDLRHQSTSRKLADFIMPG